MEILDSSLIERFDGHIKHWYNQSSRRRSKYMGNIAIIINKPILGASPILKFRMIGTNLEPEASRQRLLNDRANLVKKRNASTLGWIKRVLGGNARIYGADGTRAV